MDENKVSESGQKDLVKPQNNIQPTLPLTIKIVAGFWYLFISVHVIPIGLLSLMGSLIFAMTLAGGESSPVGGGLIFVSFLLWSLILAPFLLLYILLTLFVTYRNIMWMFAFMVVMCTSYIYVDWFIRIMAFLQGTGGGSGILDLIPRWFFYVLIFLLATTLGILLPYKLKGVLTANL